MKILNTCSVAILLAAVACGKSGPNVIDDGPGADTSGANVASNGSPIHSANGWRDTVNFYIAEDAPDTVEEGAIAAANTWNDGAGKELLNYAGRIDPTELTSLYSTLNDYKTVVYYEPKWKSHTGKTDGVLATTVWENDPDNSDYIDRGDVILNAETYYFQDATAEAEDPDRIYDIVDTESVILHEFGHLLGLDHVSESQDTDSVMHPKTYVGLDIHNRVLSDGDIKRIKQIYK